MKWPENVRCQTVIISTALSLFSLSYFLFLQLGETVSLLTDLCEGEESSRAALHQNILRIIFSGVLQLFLAAIEDARRQTEPVNLPCFSAFVKYLSAGTGTHVRNTTPQTWDPITLYFLRT